MVHINLLWAKGEKMERLLKVSEVADVLGLAESTVRKMLWKKRLQRVKVGGSTRIREGDVEALVRLGTLLQKQKETGNSGNRK